MIVMVMVWYIYMHMLKPIKLCTLSICSLFANNTSTNLLKSQWPVHLKYMNIPVSKFQLSKIE